MVKQKYDIALDRAIHTQLFFLYSTLVTLYYFLSHMQPQQSSCSESALDGKRPRVFSSEPEDPMSSPKKRQNKSFSEEQNPYDAIPELPHIKLTQEEMNSDPIQIFIKLEQKYVDYGAVKVSTCDKWKCPHIGRFVDKLITTRVQILSKLKQGKAFEQNVQTYIPKGYEAYAINFEQKYQYKTQPKGKTIQSKKQSQYWSLVTKPEYVKSNVKVEYAADLPSTKYGSGFPERGDPRHADENFAYETNLFNLNNIMNSPCSVLSMTAERKQKVSGITHPWIYMGSLFSTFCWHVEDLCVNSLNYNHKGGIKCWYVVPGAFKQKFATYVKRKYCVNNHKQTLLDRITFMVDPLELIKSGIPVYKTYQRPRDFICTFFSSYHCGFSLGYNVGEAVNFLSPLSLQIMKEQIKIKKLNPKSTPCVIPIQWIIHQNYLRLSKLKKYGEKIEEAYHEMIQLERKQLQQVKKIFTVSKVIIQPGSKKYDKVYCCKCKQYLYLHAYKITEKKIYCLEHLKKEEPAQSKIEILVREPNSDRKYILKMFGEIPIDNNVESSKRTKSKSVPTQRKKID